MTAVVIVDRLIIGGISWVLRRVAAAVDAEMNDDSVLREELLAAQMRLELGEIDEDEFADIERDLLARMREIQERRRAPADDDEASAGGPRKYAIESVEAGFEEEGAQAEEVIEFFGGKGGVGKTTLAAARARELRGRVLVASTDPAHSLGDLLGVKLSATPKKIGRSLFAVELNADRALDRWLRAHEKELVAIAERGTYLDDEDIEELFRLSLPGVDELMGLVELARLARGYDHVVVDTAPTGHTIRLLQTPDTLRRIAQVLDDMQAKHRLLAESLGGRYRRDATDALVEELDEDGAELARALRDPKRTSFTWILLPEVMSLEESRDGVAKLEELGVNVARAIVNRVTPKPRGRCALCEPRVKEEGRVIARARKELAGRAIELEAERSAKATRAKASAWREADVPLREWSGLRLLLFGGKGGVGKTTCAAAAALAIAKRAPKKRILLLSTDPAHSLGDALDARVGDVEKPVAHGLRARELDAERAFANERERYRDAVDELFDGLLRGSRFDAAYDRAVVQDLIDLAPPGLDELFAMLSLIDAAVPGARGRARYDLVIVDTAPTGHTLRLLAMPDAALEWVKAIMGILLKYRHAIGLGKLARDLTATARELRELRALLRDPARARFVAVTRAEELPRVETVKLLAALRDLEVTVGGVIVNATYAGVTPLCARCAKLAAREAGEIAELATSVKRGELVITPAEYPPPRGARALSRWQARWQGRRPALSSRRAR